MLDYMDCIFTYLYGNPTCGTYRGTVLWAELGSECCSLSGPDLFFFPCPFHCSDGDSTLHFQRVNDRGTVLWPELGSECCSLGGPDVFSVPWFPLRLRAAVPAHERPWDRPLGRAWFRVLFPRRPRRVLRLMLLSLFRGRLRAAVLVTYRGTVLWPELGSECCSLGGPDWFSVPCPFHCSEKIGRAHV